MILGSFEVERAHHEIEKAIPQNISLLMGGQVEGDTKKNSYRISSRIAADVFLNSTTIFWHKKSSTEWTIPCHLLMSLHMMES